MRCLALDVGDRRIGMAVGDDALGVVRSLDTIRRRSVVRDVARLREVVAREKVERLVIGLPLRADGGEGLQAGRVRRFAEACGSLGVPIEFLDERYTTTEAQLRGATDLDAGAAAVLLEAHFRGRAE